MIRLLASAAMLQPVDVALFRLINRDLAHPALDPVITLLSGGAWFAPVAGLLALWLVVRGGVRGRLFVGFLLASILVSDSIAANNIKKAVARERPAVQLSDTRALVGKGSSYSMPSAHAANWGAAIVAAWFFYRRWLPAAIALGLLVGFSRVYVGAHFPSDVLAGYAVGLLCGALTIRGLQYLWDSPGRRWFPLWHAALPNLIHWNRKTATMPGSGSQTFLPRPATTEWGEGPRERGPLPVSAEESEPASEINSFPDLRERQWLRLSYLLIAFLLLLRLLYLASGRIELSEDEAYQWVWSRHLALSYFSKPPFIALFQFMGTALWGDTEFGVRFFSPVLAALLSLIMLRFLAREVSARAGFWFIVVVTLTPLSAVGSLLMTIDPLLVFFWTCSMVAGWRALQSGSTGWWLITGLATGCAFLSKYTALLQLASWVVVFWLLPETRSRLRQRGPYVALATMLLCTLPVLIWNFQHQWVTVGHLATNAQLDQAWSITPRHLINFILLIGLLLNPIFFVAIVVAAARFWRTDNTPLVRYLFAMGITTVIFYLCLTIRSRVHPNWIAPAVVPFVALAVVFWVDRWRTASWAAKRLVSFGFVLGFVAVLFLHDTDLVTKFTGKRLPPQRDPLTRVRGWKNFAQETAKFYRPMAAAQKETFIVCDHYGIAGQLSFYLPEARAAIKHRPLVYVLSSDQPRNQFHLWPGYREQYRPGANALFVNEVRTPRPPPRRLLAEFEQVRDLGVYPVGDRRRTYRLVQFYECISLKEVKSP